MIARQLTRGKRGTSLLSFRSDVAIQGTVTSTAPTNFIATNTHQITFVAQNSAGVQVTPLSTTYSTSDAAVATVNASGLVTAVGVGTCTVTIRPDGAALQAFYTVVSPASAVATVDLNVFSGQQNVGQQITVVATPRDSLGNALPGRTVTVSSASAGVASVAPASGTSPLTTMVTGVAAGGPIAITYTCETKTAVYAATVINVTLQNYPYSGGNLVLRRDWNDFVSAADFRNRAGVGVYQGENANAPAHPTSDYSDWVDDPLGVFGKVCRYNYSTAITNTTAGGPEGRTATCFLDIKPFTTATERRHIWARWFMMCSADFTPHGDAPPASDSYKGMFLTWDQTQGQVVGFRGDWPLWASETSLTHEYGQAIGGGGSPSPVTETIFGTPATAFGGAWSLTSTLSGFSKPSTEQWWELVIGHKEIQATGPGRYQVTLGIRPYTVAGVVNPGTWVWRGRDATLTNAGLTLVPVGGFALGQNRNRNVASGEGPYSLYWGPFEVVKTDDNPFLTATEKWW